MDIQKYIASGILEQYVLGDLSPSEKREVEEYAAMYPAIKEEIGAIEDALEKYGQAYAVQPAAGLENKIMERIRKNAAHAPTPPAKSSKLMQAVAVTAAVLAVAAAVWGYTQSQKLQNTQQELQAAQANYDRLKTDCDAQLARKEKAEAFIAFLRDPQTRPVALTGTQKAPEATASVFWNGQQNKTYLEITSMPPVPTGKQYQLWAIVDGTPVDMGVFDVAIGTENYIEVPHIKNPQAFAVTIEKEGGNPTPTLEEMVVIGNVS